MFTSFAPQQLSDISLNDKRNMIKQLKEAIKNDIQLTKANKASLVKAKKIAAENKVKAQILAAQEKLAKLQAKLA